MRSSADEPPKIETLPEAHTDFPLRVTLESWWPFALALLVLVVAGFIYRRRKR